MTAERLPSAGASGSAALVLGQLDPGRAAAIEAHLEGCPACRAEAEALAPLGLHARAPIPIDSTSAPAPPARLGDRIARRIAAERRAARRRRARRGLGLALGAATAAATAALAIAVLRAGPRAPRFADRRLPIASRRRLGAGHDRAHHGEATSRFAFAAFGPEPCARSGFAARTAPSPRRIVPLRLRRRQRRRRPELGVTPATRPRSIFAPASDLRCAAEERRRAQAPGRAPRPASQTS